MHDIDKTIKAYKEWRERYGKENGLDDIDIDFCVSKVLKDDAFERARKRGYEI